MVATADETRVFVCLPAYNEEECIDILINKIKKGMERRNYNYDIVVYDDGSTDKTREKALAFRGSLSIDVIGDEKNQGLGYAMSRLVDFAIRHSTEDDIVVVMDCDDTHNPEQIFRMVDKILEGFELVIASRYCKESRVVGVSALRNFLSYGASVLFRLLFPIKGVKDYTCGYRAYLSRILIDAQKRYGDRLFEERGFACMAELLIKLAENNPLATEIPLILRYDKKRTESKMKVGNNVIRTLRMIAKFSWKMKLRKLVA